MTDDGYRRVHFDGDQDALGREGQWSDDAEDELELARHEDGQDFRALMRSLYPGMDRFPAGSLAFCPLPGCPGHRVEPFQ